MANVARSDERTGGWLVVRLMAAFEAAVRQDEHMVQAWIQLGLCQAENEKEAPAISALQRAVREDPLAANASMVFAHILRATRTPPQPVFTRAPGRSSLSQALAISYTNEGAESQAFDALERWLRVTYPELPASAPYVQVTERGKNDPTMIANAPAPTPALIHAPAPAPALIHAPPSPPS